MTLTFYVNEQSLSLSPACKNKKVIADSKNYLKARFIFQSKDWEEMGLKYALFTYEGKTYKKFLGAEENTTDSECFVAPEVIKPGKFSVALCGGDLVATDVVEIEVAPSGFTTEIANEKTTPTTMEQINNLMYKYASLCNDILKECQKIQEEIKEGCE